MHRRLYVLTALGTLVFVNVTLLARRANREVQQEILLVQGLTALQETQATSTVEDIETEETLPLTVPPDILAQLWVNVLCFLSARSIFQGHVGKFDGRNGEHYSGPERRSLQNERSLYASFVASEAMREPRNDSRFDGV